MRAVFWESCLLNRAIPTTDSTSWSADPCSSIYQLSYLEVVIDEVAEYVPSETHSKIFELSRGSVIAIIIEVQFHQLGAAVLVANLVAAVYP